MENEGLIKFIRDKKKKIAKATFLDFKIFELKSEHIKLLQNAYIRWDDCETGAPAIDPKRPYGNSSVGYDVAELLGIFQGREELTEKQDLFCIEIHMETLYALQIILCTGKFEPGLYVQGEGYTKHNKWVDLNELSAEMRLRIANLVGYEK